MAFVGRWHFIASNDSYALSRRTKGCHQAADRSMRLERLAIAFGYINLPDLADPPIDILEQVRARGSCLLRFGIQEVALPFDGAAFGSSKTGYGTLGEDTVDNGGGGEYYYMRGRSATIAEVRAAAIVLSGIGYTGRNIGGNKAPARISPPEKAGRQMISMPQIQSIRRMRMNGESVASIARKYLRIDDLSERLPVRRWIGNGSSGWPPNQYPAERQR
ncbi:IstB-like ATP-binding protein [Bifidobacterium sp. DSM 109963]|uniref:IstB-like ATP-binding protein n=2 Tax=Bifidobacterium panos TaxID=2675321 RepID=A0ABX1SXP0_9BIFI|nr:IstB-like ATP-binding protein [Bifidobacterium sp. DSM 109963]